MSTTREIIRRLSNNEIVLRSNGSKLVKQSTVNSENGHMPLAPPAYHAEKEMFEKAMSEFHQ